MSRLPHLLVHRTRRLVDPVRDAGLVGDELAVAVVGEGVFGHVWGMYVGGCSLCLVIVSVRLVIAVC